MGAAFESGAFGEYAAYIAALGETNAAEHSRLLRSLRRALREELTPRQLETLALFYGQRLCMTDIARIQGVNVSTVSRSLHRSCRRLEKCLRYSSRTLLAQSAAELAGAAPCPGRQRAV